MGLQVCVFVGRHLCRQRGSVIGATRLDGLKANLQGITGFCFCRSVLMPLKEALCNLQDLMA